MSALGNLLWIILGGGIFFAPLYVVCGLILCITIVGIPFGIQIFKLAGLAFLPFGREVVEGEKKTGCISILMNIIWIICGGIELAFLHAILGLIFTITVIGIPFAKQHFKLAGLALVPFGKEIMND